ncbi:MAG: hypothetical protein IPL79_05100 [Myxococcales bacterium]|nr:hypothetical protein [Myxococcales bacterium]
MKTSTSFLVVICLVAGLAAAAGCGKSTTKLQDTPETLARLETCNKTLTEAERRIAALETSAEAESLGAGGDVVVRVEGGDFVITAGQGARGGAGPQLDDATLAANSKIFMDFVSKSRTAIQRCYEQALKRNVALGNSSVKLSLAANFSPAGVVKKLTVKPTVDSGFDSCLSGVAGKWKLPVAVAGSTYQANLELRPN